MKLIATALPEVKILELTLHRDDRGFFCERFRADAWETFGLSGPLVQQNHSRSHPRVIRGLHLQHTPAQGKLVGVTRGRILDVAVDLRPHSPNFKKHIAVELSDENGRMLWVPEGFGHGFAVLGNEAADVVYHVTNYYNAAGEIGVHYADVDIGIHWPVENPIISARDIALPTLVELRETLVKVNA